MTEAPLQSVVEPAELQRERELARKNMVWGWALFVLFLVLFGGTVLVAAAYLWLD